MESEKTEIRSGNSSCFVCLEQFSSQKSMKMCCKCLNFSCKIHLKSFSNDDVCEKCIRSEMKSEIIQSYALRLSSALKEIKEYESREESLKNQILKSDLKIDSLTQAAQSNENSSILSTSTLTSQITSQTTENLSLQLQESSLTSQISESEKTIQNFISILSLSQTEILKQNKELSRSQQKLDHLSVNLSQLIQSCKASVPYRRLRNTTCNKCHTLIKIKMKEEIFQVLDPRTADSLLTSLFADSPTKPTRDQTPCQCLLF